MTKILFIGDPHIKNTNMVEIDLLLNKLKSLCEEHLPDFIVVAGDVLDEHEKIWTPALNKAYNFIDMLRQYAKTFVLVGNHDYISNVQFLSKNHWLNAMKEWSNVIIVDEVITQFVSNHKFIFVPYVSNGRFIEALNTSNDSWQDASCIFAHQEFKGCKMGAITSIDGDSWDLSYPFVISGHIHSKQSPQHNIYYPGSALQIAFGESEHNIIPIITFENNNHSINEIDLQLPRKKIVYVDIDKVDDLILDSKTEDSIKFTVKGKQEDFKAFKKGKKYKEILKSGAKIVFKVDKKIESQNKEFIGNIKERNFKTILKSLVDKENNSYLNDVYESLITQ